MQLSSVLWRHLHRYRYLMALGSSRKNWNPLNVKELRISDKNKSKKLLRKVGRACGGILSVNAESKRDLKFWGDSSSPRTGLSMAMNLEQVLVTTDSGSARWIALVIAMAPISDCITLSSTIMQGSTTRTKHRDLRTIPRKLIEILTALLGGKRLLNDVHSWKAPNILPVWPLASVQEEVLTSQANFGRDGSSSGPTTE